MFKKNILMKTAALTFCVAVTPLNAIEFETKVGNCARVAAAAAPMLAHNNNSSWPTVSRINRFLGEILSNPEKEPHFDRYVDAWHNFVGLLNADGAVICGKPYFTENGYSALLSDLTSIDPTRLNSYCQIARNITSAFPHQVGNTRILSVLTRLPAEHLDDYVNALTALSSLDFSKDKDSLHGGAVAFLEVLKANVKPDVIDRVMTGVQEDLTVLAITSYDKATMESLVRKRVNQVESELMSDWFTRDVLSEIVLCTHDRGFMGYGTSELDIALNQSFNNYRARELNHDTVVEKSTSAVAFKERSFQLKEVSGGFWNQYNIIFTSEMTNELADSIYPKIVIALSDVDHTSSEKMNGIAGLIDAGRMIMLRQAKKVQYPS